ncbi:hypothetical protein BD289DRAFT_444530 [Coniella lustricola]|uniref:Heterokaryon incompatibility domain-containing protein n=1 Tax=Coniella lustricola TaxID=2025994 RepID=A0A2T2ZVS0_9PEZI|nr:hypothetical protein BD289DRAFT_444530 [Coniella lustricola]
MVLDVFDFLLRLEISYLWIDSVCIVQSSEVDNYLDDWKTEAQTMGSVYSSAVLTVSALSCDSPGQGLFD